MSQQDTRFERLSREILNGSYPYGVLPGEPIPDEFVVVLVHDEVPSATVILAVTRNEGARAALTFRNTTSSAAERVQRDFQQFMEEMHHGEDGAMLPFSFLPRRIAMRRLRKLANAN